MSTMAARISSFCKKCLEKMWSVILRYLLVQGFIINGSRVQTSRRSTYEERAEASQHVQGQDQEDVRGRRHHQEDDRHLPRRHRRRLWAVWQQSWGHLAGSHQLGGKPLYEHQGCLRQHVVFVSRFNQKLPGPGEDFLERLKDWRTPPRDEGSPLTTNEVPEDVHLHLLWPKDPTILGKDLHL